VVFEGTFDEVNRFFYENEWSDGLPIVPPTADRVGEFLRSPIARRRRRSASSCPIAAAPPCGRSQSTA
jgi:hypothetical protein